MRTLYHGTPAAATTATPTMTQLELVGLEEAIAAAIAACARQERALRELFTKHGYDLSNGDMLFHARDVALDVPPRYRAQVRPSDVVPPGQIVFTRNPRFSLF